MKMLPMLALLGAFVFNCGDAHTAMSDTTMGSDYQRWNQRTRPYIIGHRGTPSYMPEETAAGYLLAIDSGVDFIECDVVITKDLVLVCRHEPWLSTTTDAMSVYPESIKTYLVDGYNITDVFVNDLTLAEMRALRCKQKSPYLSQSFNGLFQMITFEEYMQIALSADRTVGIYPELKHPTWFNNLPIMEGLRFADLLLDALTKYGYAGQYGSPSWLKQPCYIQCFEQDELVYASAKTCIPLVQLIDGPGSVTVDRNKTFVEMTSDASLDEIASYASGAGPWKVTLAAPNANGTVISSGLTERLQDRGMQVQPYTLRPEANQIFPSIGNLNQYNEYDLWFKTEGIDGAFTDSGTILYQYFNAHEIAGFAWPLNSRMRWNARPATCKRAMAMNTTTVSC